MQRNELFLGHEKDFPYIEGGKSLSFEEIKEGGLALYKKI